MLTLTAADANGVSQMQFSNDGSTWSIAEAYAVSKNWTLSAADGIKTVYVRYKDNPGNWTASTTATIDLKEVGSLKVEVVGHYEVTAGTAFSLRVSAIKPDAVTVEAGYRNFVSGTVPGDAGASVPANYQFVAGDNGVKGFSVILRSIGLQTVRIADTNVGTINGETQVTVYQVSPVITASAGGAVSNVDGTLVNIPAGALSGDAKIGFKVTAVPVDPGISYYYKNTVNPISRDFGIFDNSVMPWQLRNVTFNKPVKITIPYSVSDIGTTPQSLLRIYYYDPLPGKYVLVSGTQTVSGGTVTAEVTHFSTYRVMGLTVKNNLDEVLGYPNPFNPSVGKEFKISNLTQDAVVVIYNIAGENLRTLREADYGNLGFVIWNGKTDSGELLGRGIYIYVIKDSTGGKKIGKVALIK